MAPKQLTLETPKYCDQRKPRGLILTPPSPPDICANMSRTTAISMHEIMLKLFRRLEFLSLRNNFKGIVDGYFKENVPVL